MAAAEKYVMGDLNATQSLADALDKKRERSTAVLYAERRLTEWAKWARENRDGLGYPTISMLYKAMKERLEPKKMKRVEKWDLEPNEAPKVLTAIGVATRNFFTPSVDAPEAIMETDGVVRRLPPDLHEVIIADFFTYGPIEVRAKKTKWKRARYSQLLECAKYSVYAALDSRTLSDDPN
jgi:hypothetical protein